MSTLNVSLFGKFSVRLDDGTDLALNGAKVRELFGYLLLNRNRPLLREKLATVLWEDLPGAQSKSYLRKAVWQMQTALGDGGVSFLSVDAEWIQLNTGPDLWLDAAQFESAYKLVEDVSGKELTEDDARTLMAAAALYDGDLLEGWYQEWCLFERERLERMYLNMLEKLIHYCAMRGRYEAGIGYGMQALRLDRVRERTYRRLMQLHYLAGNRSEALHEYANCVAVLKKELGVEPSPRTTTLYRRIVAGALDRNGQKRAPLPESDTRRPAQIEELWQLLAETQQLVQHNMKALAAGIEGLRGEA